MKNSHFSSYCIACSLYFVIALSGLEDHLSAVQLFAEEHITLPARIPSENLPNLVHVHRDVWSGGLPGNEHAFSELQRLGIKTIISVDATTPDVVSAENFEMRYVHLPHGYDGISEERVLEIAKAIRELPKPVYIHCHHGHHRSPAAASAACVAAGLMPENKSLSILEIAKTGKNFIGLYESVKRTRFVSDRDWSKVAANFQSISPIPPIAAAMVTIEIYFDHIQTELIHDSKDKHVDKKSITYNLLMLRELYAELQREERSQKDEVFMKYLVEGAEIISKIESIELERTAHLKLIHEGLQGQEDTTANTTLTRLNSARLKSISELQQNCKACHQSYRDIPAMASPVVKVKN